MKTRLPLTLALLLWGTIDSQAVTLVQPPRMSAIIGEWVGFSIYGQFIRLELDGDGNGYLSIQDQGVEKVDLHKVRNWSLSTEYPWPISLKIERITPDTDRFTKERISEATEDTLELEWKYELVDYAMKATLHKERDFRRLSARSKTAIKAAKRKKH